MHPPMQGRLIQIRTGLLTGNELTLLAMMPRFVGMIGLLLAQSLSFALGEQQTSTIKGLLFRPAVRGNRALLRCQGRPATI